MTSSDYQPGHTLIHRTPPVIKLLLLACTGTALFLLPQLWLTGAVALLVVLLYLLAGLSWRLLLRQVKPLWPVLLLLFVVQGLLVSWPAGVLVVVRLAALILAAALITLTTRSSAMIAALEKSLGWLRFLGINPAKVSLALALAMRFIPVLAAITVDVREAQKARGLDHSIIAIAVPVMVRTLKMAEDISQAIEARAYDAAPDSNDNPRA
ncbi:energy-coupling factor transporter transmembrane component T family protein [Pantoea sp. A4]|uniref:energy-coupling factor transporter transmembrane component T family protein n=1 Tax=Pantoea sp. A4 TaxID=1225184 RepID=UPI00035F9D5F|nr:energy-coupling factor transporter transmembrane protein EcfT [Pantoea sp. A4]